MASRSLSPQDRSSSKSTRPWLRAAIALVLFGALLYFFWPLIGEFREAVELFRVADWKWLRFYHLQVIYTLRTAECSAKLSGKIGFGRLQRCLLRGLYSSRYPAQV
jgi:H+/Cl- antiporter ClcA